MKKLFIGLAVCGIFLAGCHKKEASTPQQTPQNTSSASQTANAPVVTETITLEKVYEGTLPCADCSGIKTQLKLHSKANDPNANKYELTQTYLGKEPNNTFVTTGTYTVENDTNTDNNTNTTIYTFTPDQPDMGPTYYAVYSNDPTTMHMLDSDMKKIEDDMQSVLKLAN